MFTYRYEWPGVDGTVVATSEALARAAIRARYGLHAHKKPCIPNRAVVERLGAPRPLVGHSEHKPAVGPIVVKVGDPDVYRQVRRMLESMRAFRFDQGGAWHAPVGADSFEEGYTPRLAGDPIFHTIGELAGLQATRAQTEEALAAVVEARAPKLPKRFVRLSSAAVEIAAALAAGRRVVRTDEGPLRIQGPILPPDWDTIPLDIV